MSYLKSKSLKHRKQQVIMFEQKIEPWEIPDRFRYRSTQSRKIDKITIVIDRIKDDDNRNLEINLLDEN